MSDSRSFLFEIGTEELPPKALKNLSQVLHTELLAQFEKHKIIDSGVASSRFASPRRLAVLIEDVSLMEPDQVINRRGPAVNAAFDDQGAPTKAALGFAKSVGVDINELQTQKTDKGEWLFYQIKQPGRSAQVVIPTCIDAALKSLPIPKRMRWGDLDAEFIRPVKWLVVLHGSEVIDTQILSVKSDRFSYGHRFHTQRQLRFREASDYESVLEQDGLVIANFTKRQQMIKVAVQQLAQEKDGRILENQSLLDEVTGLVELPVPLIGNIDEEFMSLPQESLVSSMQNHQKYFPIVDQKNKLLPYFITVSNIRSSDESRVINGNERVLRARLSDAEFFWQKDQKTSLDGHCVRLKNVLFHQKLGSMADKVERIQLLAKELAQKLNLNVEMASRAAQICKADLVTDMVGEFPELQGTMGKYYALNDGETLAVAQAVEQHYWPKFAGDQIPVSNTAKTLALADKLDTICGIFVAGEVPRGDRDPFGLRRNALGILRILIESQIDLNLKEAIKLACENYSTDDQAQSLVETIYNFIFERLKAHYQSQGIDTRIYQAVAEVKPVSPFDFDKRVHAVKHFSELRSAQSLIEANKRITNILQKNQHQPSEINQSILEQEEEIALFDQLKIVNEKISTHQNSHNYGELLSELASLKESVDAFFDHVMVMDEDLQKQQNRIALLSQLRQLLGQVADISFLK